MFRDVLESGAVISHNGGDIFPIFSCFLSITVSLLYTIAGYFTSETMMAPSDWNITIFSFKDKKQMKRNIFISEADIKH